MVMTKVVEFMRLSEPWVLSAPPMAKLNSLEPSA